MKRSEDAAFLRWAQMGLSAMVKTGAPWRTLRNSFDLACRGRSTVTEQDCDQAEEVIRGRQTREADSSPIHSATTE